MKKLIVILLMFPLLALANLSNRGPYVGGQIGYGDSHSYAGGTSWNSYRILGGWRLTDHFAIEGGFTNLIDKPDAKFRGYDLIGKVITPIAFHFSAYIKGGSIYMQNKYDSYDQSRFMFLLGGGIGFNITKGINVDASFTHAYGRHGVNDMDFAALGLSYTLGVIK